MTKWVCTVCGYVYEGDAAPAECPVCHVGADKFKKVEGDLTLAAEHEYGVYAKTVKNNPEISDEQTSMANALKLVCTSAWLVLLTARDIRKLVFTGRKLLTKRQNMQQNLLRC